MVSYGTWTLFFWAEDLDLVAKPSPQPSSFCRPCGLLYYTNVLSQKTGSTIPWFSDKLPCLTFRVTPYEQWMRTAWINTTSAVSSLSVFPKLHIVWTVLCAFVHGLVLKCVGKVPRHPWCWQEVPYYLCFPQHAERNLLRSAVENCTDTVPTLKPVSSLFLIVKTLIVQ